MINETKERITLTLTKKQIEYIREFSKSHYITPSQMVSWSISKKSKELYKLAQCEKYGCPKPINEEDVEQEHTNEEWDNLINNM